MPFFGELLGVAKSKLPAHMIGTGNVKACLECGMEFPAKSRTSPKEGILGTR